MGTLCVLKFTPHLLDHKLNGIVENDRYLSAWVFPIKSLGRIWFCFVSNDPPTAQNASIYTKKDNRTDNIKHKQGHGRNRSLLRIDGLVLRTREFGTRSELVRGSAGCHSLSCLSTYILSVPRAVTKKS